ncbi:unnamed protein product [Closterium sp. NIES-54]
MMQYVATATTALPAASLRHPSAAGGNASETAVAAAVAVSRSTCVSAVPSVGEAANPNAPSRTSQTGQEDLNPTATADAASPVTPVTASGKQQQQRQPHAQQ